MCDSSGLASYNKLGVGFIDTGSGGSGTIPTLQQVTEVGASTDQPILFEDTVTLSQLPNTAILATDVNGKIIAGNGTFILGTGIANQLAYFDTTNSISNLDTATYPSLTELSYVKGVTSSIQTQINNKLTLPSLTNGSVLFSNGTTIAQDNSNFFWDNGRLGIGTNLPFNGLPSIISGGVDIGSRGVNGKEGILMVGGFSSLGGISRSSWGAVGSNYYLASSGLLLRRFNEKVSILDFENGGFVFRTSGSGAVGSAISTTILMRLHESGNFCLNTLDFGQKLQVDGTVRITNKLFQPTTANSPKGTATLVNGVVTISNTLATTGCFIQVNYITGTAVTGTSSILTVSSLVNATSFTVTALNAGTATTNTSDNNVIEYTISN